MLRLITALSVAVAMLTVGGAYGSAQDLNPIQVENSLPGSTKWKPIASTLGTGGPIDGYAQRSVLVGSPVDFRVATDPAARYRIDIYRLGYYAGKGGRRVTCLPSCTSDSQGVKQPVPDPEPGYAAAPNWPITDSWTVPGDAVSGYYLARLVLTSGSKAGTSLPVPFIVRDDRSAPMLVQASVNTWNAYDSWGGKSLYPFNSTNGIPAHHATFDRPLRDDLSHEQPFVYWLEQQGYDATYTTDIDVDANPDQLLDHNVDVVNGHSEYWTRAMRQGYEAARDAGVNLAFIGGNDLFWQVRYEDDRHTLVAFKEYWQDDDPLANTPDWTIQWQDLDPPEPECALIGAGYYGGLQRGTAKPAYKVTAASDPWFAGSGFVDGSSLPRALGHEWDRVEPGCTPDGTVVLMHAQLAQSKGGNADMTRYVAPSGATVFSTGALGVVLLLKSNPGLSVFMQNAFNELSG